jgi:hypothetical protein
LGDRRRNLEAEVEDLALALETNVLGPLDHTRKVASGLDVLANTKVAWAALDERVLPSCQYSDAEYAKSSLSIPWPASCQHRPWRPGKALAQPSWFLLLSEAIIEKNSQLTVLSLRDYARHNAIAISRAMSHHWSSDTMMG